MFVDCDITEKRFFVAPLLRMTVKAKP